MPAYERNLVLVHTPRLQARSDFETIKRKLAERAPDIEVFIVDNGQQQSVTRKAASRRPALVFSPVALRTFRPLRGKIYTGRPCPKLEEIRLLQAAGINVPETVMLQPHMSIDPATWGPFTIVKPNVGRQGAGVRLQRTRDVHWVDPFSWPRNDPRFGHQLLAQRFVDTGRHSSSWRVLVVFGRPVYSIVSRALKPRGFDLDPNGLAPIDEPAASNTQDRTVVFNDDATVIDCAVDAARRLPQIPSLGIDVIREEATGRLYVLEVNPRGLTWTMSSDYGRDFQRRYGLDLYTQFNALDVIAAALIDVTRREAA